MARPRWRSLIVLAAVMGLVAAACGDGGGGGGGELDKVTVQLKWVTQAQFAGYYAALDQGYYEDEGLDVTILPGGPDITPEQVVAGGQAEFGLNWLPSTLAQRDQGVDLVNIAQVFTRAGITEVAWKDTGIDSIDDLAGKNVGVWCCGNQYQLFAALNKNGIDPNDPSQVTIVDQPFDMSLLLNREVDAAAAMTYNELAQVLETENPDTGALYTLDDLNVIKLADVGTGMLEDGIFVRGDWIAEEENQDIAVRFLKATFKGWIYCRDNLQTCVDLVLAEGSALGAGHQLWQMNEINALVWPAPLGIGIMDPALFQTTADISLDFGVIANAASDDAFVTEFAEEAVQQLQDEGVDVNGNGYVKGEVEVTPGGE
ncbi:MAG: ABC transporter substrate-binding protein [Actinomycetota bacterium]